MSFIHKISPKNIYKANYLILCLNMQPMYYIITLILIQEIK